MDLLGCFYSAEKKSVILSCVCITRRHSTVVVAGRGAMPVFGLCCTAVSAAVEACWKECATQQSTSGSAAENVTPDIDGALWKPTGPGDQGGGCF